MRRTCLCFVLLAACAGEADPSTPDANASLAPLGGSGVQGSVEITEMADGELRVDADITGLTPGMHGMHVHEWGDCSSADGMSAGGHFNPAMVDHGAPNSATHHPGDFGNIEADADGRAVFTLTLDAGTFSLSGAAGVLGRAIIVHEKPDDFGQPTGNAGGRLACGVIQNLDGDAAPVLNPSPDPAA
ncbi:MAG: superoxide dismutase family protein [Myxococcales bacterium]|nr:superoxide dismutase family protein [Myxococcales bacterium]